MSDLKELLGEELYEQVKPKLDDNHIVIDKSEGQWVPKEKFSSVNDEVKDLKQQLSDRDTQLDNLKTKAAGNEDLTKQIEDLKAENKTTADGYQEKLDQQAKDFAIDSALRDVKAKNVKAVRANLNLDNIKQDGSQLLGIDDQLKALKESDGYLFEEEQPKGKGANPANTDSGGKNPFAKDSFNLTEQGKLFRENPDKAAQLEAAAK